MTEVPPQPYPVTMTVLCVGCVSSLIAIKCLAVFSEFRLH